MMVITKCLIGLFLVHFHIFLDHKVLLFDLISALSDEVGGNNLVGLLEVPIVENLVGNKCQVII